MMIWTDEDYAEYQRQLQIIEKAYGNGVPKNVKERYAAQIVNAQKGL